ncbi:MAG: hypothetical protein ACLFSW_02890 [Halobacteriales archaeon]
MRCGNCRAERETRQALFEKDGRVVDTTFLCTACLGRLRWDADCVLCGRGEREASMSVKHARRVGGRRVSDAGGVCVRCRLRLRVERDETPRRVLG